MSTCAACETSHRSGQRSTGAKCRGFGTLDGCGLCRLCLSCESSLRRLHPISICMILREMLRASPSGNGTIYTDSFIVTCNGILRYDPESTCASPINHVSILYKWTLIAPEAKLGLSRPIIERHVSNVLAVSDVSTLIRMYTNVILELESAYGDTNS